MAIKDQDKFAAAAEAEIEAAFDRLRELGVEAAQIFIAAEVADESTLTRCMGFGLWPARVGMIELWRRGRFAYEEAHAAKEAEEE